MLPSTAFHKYPLIFNSRIHWYLQESDVFFYHWNSAFLRDFVQIMWYEVAFTQKFRFSHLQRHLFAILARSLISVSRWLNRKASSIKSSRASQKFQVHASSVASRASQKFQEHVSRASQKFQGHVSSVASRASQKFQEHVSSVASRASQKFQEHVGSVVSRASQKFQTQKKVRKQKLKNAREKNVIAPPQPPSCYTPPAPHVAPCTCVGC